MSVARAWVDEAFHHSTTLLAHETALRLLVRRLTTFPSLPQHLTVIRSLTSSLAADAFSAGLHYQSSEKAIELLEQGRGVFWSQLIRLRSPLDGIVEHGPAGRTLADESDACPWLFVTHSIHLVQSSTTGCAISTWNYKTWYLASGSCVASPVSSSPRPAPISEAQPRAGLSLS